MYQERMIGYYPRVIGAITEFKSIIDAEYPEFEMLAEGRDKVVNDAYLLTMSEDRVEQWEAVLGIKPLADSSVDDRRDTVIARIRGQGKLNTALINAIVNAFTGGTANSWIKDSVLYVEITPPPESKQYQFANVEQELKLKVPAHLGFNITRNYYEWIEVKNDYSTWQDVKDNFDTWDDVRIFIKRN